MANEQEAKDLEYLRKCNFPFGYVEEVIGPSSPGSIIIRTHLVEGGSLVEMVYFAPTSSFEGGVCLHD